MYELLSSLQFNQISLLLRLKTTDWPAAVARDFLLAASNTVPLYTPPGTVAAVEYHSIDDDVRVLAQLANKIQENNGNSYI